MAYGRTPPRAPAALTIVGPHVRVNVLLEGSRLFPLGGPAPTLSCLANVTVTVPEGAHTLFLLSLASLSARQSGTIR